MFICGLAALHALASVELLTNVYFLEVVFDEVFGFENWFYFCRFFGFVMCRMSPKNATDLLFDGHKIL